MTTNQKGFEMATDHAVFARGSDGNLYRVTEPMGWNQAVASWQRKDDQRRARQFPHVKFFEVRSMDDPKYMDAPVSLRHCEPVPASRGFKHAEDAARRAWRMWQGEQTPHGRTQGTGGWFYYHSGRTAAQGMDGLLALCERRGLICQGTDGRYYSMVSNLAS
jgi:hypothetical protein